MCEQIPRQGFESFKQIGDFCLEAGGPPELCASVEDKCREVGVTTPDECYLILSIATVTTSVAPILPEEGARINSSPQTSSQPSTGRDLKALEARCLEAGGPPEICTMKTGQSYKDLEVKCLESGGSPEICASAETKCALIGAKTADECERMNLETFLNTKLEMLKQEVKP
jgi:hypothetical protein